MLSIRGLEAGYGKLPVLRGLDLDLKSREVSVVLGANGAGKTTLCRVISGLLPAWSGRIEFDGVEVNGLSAAQRVRLGIGQVPEGRQVFPRMTVLENLRLGAFVHGHPRPQDLERCYGLFPILHERRNHHAGLLSGGEQQMLALARCLMSRPRLLLLDEPSQGLAPRAVEQVGHAVNAIATEDIAIMLVEQNLQLAEMVAQQAIILDMGQAVKSGRADEILRSGEVEGAYLGR